MEVAEFEHQLSQMNKLSAERRVYKTQYNKRSMSDMNSEYSSINWQTFFDKLYKMTGVSMPVDGNYMVSLLWF